MKKHLSWFLALMFYWSTLPVFAIDYWNYNANNLVVKSSPWVDVTAYMDGVDGRPTVKEWRAAQTTTDVTSALRAAILAQEDNTTSSWPFTTVSHDLVFPPGTYAISGALHTKSFTRLRGYGSQSVITTLSGFADNAIILMEGGPAAMGYHTFSSYFGLKFHSDNTSIAALRQSNTAYADAPNSLSNCTFDELYFDLSYGLMLDTYAQNVKIGRLYSTGPIEQILKLVGNANQADVINVENEMGTTTDALVEVRGYDFTPWGGSPGASQGNKIGRLVLEGAAASTNKKYFSFDNVFDLEIDGVWMEGTGMASVGASIRDSNQVRFLGPFNGIVTTNTVSIERSANIEFDQINLGAFDVTPYAVISMDNASYVTIKQLKSYGGRGVYNIDNAIKNHLRVLKTEYNAPIYQTGMSANEWAHVTPVYSSSSNWFLNPSFESGNLGWTFSAAPDSVDEYIASEVNLGLMAHWKWTATATPQVYQRFNITTATYINKPVSLTALVKVVGPDNAYVKPWFTDGEIIGGGYVVPIMPVYANTGWHIICSVLTTGNGLTGGPGSTAFGIEGHLFDNDTHLYVDDMRIAPGIICTPDGSRFGSIELGGNLAAGADSRTITFGSAAPVTGTCKSGDIVLNNGVDNVLGWKCTVAGTPGTWKYMQVTLEP